MCVSQKGIQDQRRELVWGWGGLEHDDRLRALGLELMAEWGMVRVMVMSVGSGARLLRFESQLHLYQLCDLGQVS